MRKNSLWNILSSPLSWSKACELDGERSLTANEKEALMSFEQPDHAFSLMFSVYFAKDKICFEPKL